MRTSSKRALSSLMAVLAILSLAPHARADVKAGVDAWSRGDYATAISEWREPAERGDADAQFNLGQAYKLGKGVPQNLQEAEEQFGRAAAQGHIQASDNYGLLLFQRGERAKGMPFIAAAAGRGDPRAQYLLGIAHFNGDFAAKDWVRAYALVSLAQQAGLQQARAALVEMDKHIPLDQRQKAASLSVELASQAEANRARQLAAQDLGVAPVTTAAPARPASGAGARNAGADFARPVPSPTATKVAASKPNAAKPAVAAPPPANQATAPKPPVAAGAGTWRVQLGAFGVATNADALWNRVKGRPELAGHGRIDAKAGSVTKLQAGGFASQAEAQAACRALTSAGITCLPVRN